MIIFSNHLTHQKEQWIHKISIQQFVSHPNLEDQVSPKEAGISSTPVPAEYNENSTSSYTDYMLTSGSGK